MPTQIELLANEILRWMKDEELHQTARDRARAFVWEHYDWDKIAARWKRRYQDVIASVLPPSPTKHSDAAGKPAG